MVARDDSVIRGSLIACLIFLVLSLALNFFFWRWANTEALEADRARDSMRARQTELQATDDQKRLLKAMLGYGNLSAAERDLLKESSSGDADMDAIVQQYNSDMALFGQDVADEERNYPRLPAYLMDVIRSRNDQYSQARSEVERMRVQADSDVANARKAQELAEQKSQDTQKQLDQERNLFVQDRERINQEKEETRDSLTKTVQEFTAFRNAKRDETASLTRKSEQLQTTIETQKLQLNQLRNDQFETVQGNISYVRDNIVTINLGSADALRPGVTFGVISGEETRLQDAKVKATIQVTQILGAHLAQARVVLRPEIKYPIIPGDFIYSPFWAPGRKVKIALAGDIDIDGDGKPDNEALKGMITAAGAEVVAEVAANGTETGKLDASVRFLVLDEQDEGDEEVDPAQLRALSSIKGRARELGLTIIPAWKLQAYLRTIDDTLTTPLGSAVRGKDFAPEPDLGTNQRLPNNLPEIYRRQTEGMQLNNEILQP